MKEMEAAVLAVADVIRANSPKTWKQSEADLAKAAFLDNADGMTPKEQVDGLMRFSANLSQFSQELVRAGILPGNSKDSAFVGAIKAKLAELAKDDAVAAQSEARK